MTTHLKIAQPLDKTTVSQSENGLPLGGASAVRCTVVAPAGMELSSETIVRFFLRHARSGIVANVAGGVNNTVPLGMTGEVNIGEAIALEARGVTFDMPVHGDYQDELIPLVVNTNTSGTAETPSEQTTIFIYLERLGTA